MTLPRARRIALQALKTAAGRREQGAFLVEGEKLIREAIAPGAAAAVVRELLVTAEHVAAAQAVARGLPLTPISQADAERLADTRTPQGWFAVAEDCTPNTDALLAALGKTRPAPAPLTVVALDAVQDPGNVGAVLRVAAAFAVDAVLLGPGCADATHPRVIRAATGAWFRLPLARSPDLGAALGALHDAGCTVIGAAEEGASVFAAVVAAEAPARRVLVLGNEGAGFSADVAARLDQTVGVPMAAGVESLNVAVAAGILLAEWRHPRAGGG